VVRPNEGVPAVSPPRRIAVAAAALVLACAPLLSGCTGSGTAKPVRPRAVAIGVLAPAGGDAVRGAQLAIDIVNDAHPELDLPLAGGAGVLGGVRITLDLADTKASAAGVTEQVTRLAKKDDVVGFVAADSTVVTGAISERAEALRIPLIDAGTSADNAANSGLDWYHRIGPTDRVLAQTGFAVLRQQQGPDPTANRRVALLDSGSDGAAATSRAVKEFADAQQLQVVFRESIGPTSASTPAAVAALVAELAAKVNQARPELFLAVAANEQEAAVVADLAKRLATTPTVLFGRGVAGIADSVARPVPGGQGLLRPVAWSAEFLARNPMARAVAGLYERRYNVPLTPAAAGAFTATLTMATGVDSAGGADRARIRAALRQLSLPATKTIMPWNGVQFDGDGQNTLASGVVEQSSATGFHIVYPRELATAPVAWRSTG
jgi:branched-chain amino acid transport system substrate-binding protein